eukprot:6858518-Ditylum_brightwellii.AAC.1
MSGKPPQQDLIYCLISWIKVETWVTTPELSINLSNPSTSPIKLVTPSFGNLLAVGDLDFTTPDLENKLEELMPHESNSKGLGEQHSVSEDKRDHCKNNIGVADFIGELDSETKSDSDTESETDLEKSDAMYNQLANNKHTATISQSDENNEN